MSRLGLALALLLTPRLAAADEVDPPGAPGRASQPAPTPADPPVSPPVRAPQAAEVVAPDPGWPRELVLGGVCLLVAVLAGLALRRR